MRRATERQGADANPAHATCDFCGHRHACYVGGRPTYDTVAQVTRWERHVCLGCAMRAGTPGGFESCADCEIPSARGTGQDNADA